MLNRVCGAVTLLLIGYWVVLALLPMHMAVKGIMPSLPMQECITEDSGPDPSKPCFFMTDSTDEGYVIVPPANER